MKKQDPRGKQEADGTGAENKFNDNIDPREISSRDKDYLIHELQTRQIELSMQNEELRATRRDLAQSRQKYSSLFDLAPVAYVTFDREGYIRDANLAAAQLLGVEKQVLLNKPSSPFIHPDNIHHFSNHLAKAFHSGSLETCIIVMKKKDGSDLLAELRSIVTNAHVEAAGFCSTAIIDHNGQMQLERDLRAREEEFRSMFELSAIGKAQLDPATCKFIRVNKRFSDITGYSTPELLDMTFNDLTHPDERGREKCFERALRKETPGWKVEKRYVRKDGVVIWVKITGTVLFDAMGAPYRAMAAIEDITESRNADQALRESEERYRSLVESLPEGIFVQQAGICVYVNRAGLDLLQAKNIDEVRGRKILDFIHPEFREKAEKRIQQIEEGGHVVPRELRILRLDGQELDVEADSIPIIYGGRRAVQILIKDITGRWESELRLRLQATVLSQVNDAVVAVGLDGRIIFWNRGAERLYKLSAEEAIGKRRDAVYQYRWPTPQQDRAAKEAMASSRFLRGENIHLLWNGEEIHVESSVSLLLSWSGLPAGWLAVMRDITERKVFEQRLKESEERYRTLAENLPGIVYRVFCRENNRMHFFNRAASAIIGYAADELSAGQFCSLEELILCEDRGEVVAAVYKAVEQKRSFFIEYRLRNRSGEIRHLMEQGTPVYDGKGSLLYIDGVISDVTERKHAEQAIKEARDAAERERQHLEIILNTIPSGVFVAEAPHGGITLQNKQARDILGRDMSDENALIPDLVQKYEMRHTDGGFFSPEEIPYRRALAGEDVTGVEMTTRRPDGSIITILSNAAPIRDADGSITGSVAAFTDITERKRAEDELKRVRVELELRVKERTGELAATIDALQAEIAERRRTAAERDKLVAAVESAAEAIVVTDKNGLIQYVNPAFEQVTGYGRQEALGGNVHLFDSGQHDEEFFREMRETIRSQGAWKGRLINKKKDGTIYHEDCTYSPVKDTSGNIVNYVSIKHDVTEKLRLEAIAEAVDAMNNIGYVFSGIRHEIGNPVSSLLIIMSLLKKKYETSPREAIGEYVDQAISQVERIEYLLTSLKNFNMYENLHIRSIDASSFFEKFIPLVTSDLSKKGIHLQAGMPPRDCFLAADPRALQQALLNIIVNSSDALAGRQEPAICLTVFRTGTMVRIRVSDNGVGISEERKKDLFKPFYTTKAHGTGLGLVISRKLVSRMKGFIEITSQVNKGTNVDIYLPEGSSECTIEQKKKSPGH